MQPTWTITGQRPDSRGVLQTAVSQSFDTKRKAVNAMMADREPKTAITRIGHSYLFTARKDGK